MKAQVKEVDELFEPGSPQEVNTYESIVDANEGENSEDAEVCVKISPRGNIHSVSECLPQKFLRKTVCLSFTIFVSIEHQRQVNRSNMLL